MNERLMRWKKYLRLAAVLAVLLPAVSGRAQTPENSFNGSIQLSGTCCNVGPNLQVFCNMPTGAINPPQVTIHTTTGGTYSVVATAVGGTGGPNRWRAEQQAWGTFNIGALATSQQSLAWSNGMRALVLTGGVYFYPESHTLPQLTWRVDLNKNGVTLDSAYAIFTVSGQFTAMCHSGHPWSGMPYLHEMTGSTMDIPMIHLYESLNKLTVNFSVLDERIAKGIARISLRVGKKVYPMGISFPKYPAREQRFTFTLSERLQLGPVTGSLVEVLVDDVPMRSERVPAAFTDNVYVANLGLIHLAGDKKCQSCTTCILGEVKANLKTGNR